MLSNIFWLMFDSLLRLGGTFLINVWLAKYLGPDYFGVFSYALAFVGLFSAFGISGLNPIVVRDIVRNSLTINETLGTVFVFRFIGGCLTVVTAVIGIHFIKPGDVLVHYLVVIVSLGIILQIFDTIDAYFESQVQSKYVIWAKDTIFLAIFIIKTFLIYKKAPLIVFAWAYTIEILLNGAVILMVYHLRGHHLTKWYFSLKRAKDLIKSGWPLICANAVSMVYLSISPIMLEHMVNSRAVGIYTAAIRLSEVWYFIPAAILSSLFPIVINIRKENREAYNEKFQILYNILTLLSLTVAIIVTIFAKPIMNLVYGENYVQAYKILAIHIWSGVFVCLAWVSSYWFLEENLSKLYLYRIIPGCVVCILLNLLLIPWWGALGAAISMVISRAVIVFVTAYFSESKHKIHIFLQSFNIVENILNIVRSLVQNGVVIHNVYRNKDTKSKRVLLIYKITPFLFFWLKNDIGHQHFKQCQQIGRLLHQMGFIVDVADINNSHFLPSKKYDLIISHRLAHNFDENHVWKGAIKICLTASMCNTIYNKFLLKRYENLSGRKNTKLFIRGLKNEQMSYVSKADAIVGFGNDCTISTWKNIFHGQIYKFNNYGFENTKFISSKDFKKVKKNFLFFASGPQVLKGLDILLEIFIKHPDLNLYVCSPFELEKDFCELYHKELYHTSNIHPIGTIRVNGPEFYDLCTKCAFVILPAASEGVAGSVVQCMHTGLIPIITKETGIDDEQVILFENDSILEIERTILKYSNLSEEWYQEQTLRIRKLAKEKYSEQQFINRWKEIIMDIIK